jgi:signal transduction histidine kinase
MEADDAALMLGKILDETRRISRLVDDLLGFSRERELVLEQVDVVKLLQTLAEDVRNTVAHAEEPGEEVPVTLEVAPRTGGDVRWRLDQEAVRQVFSNLLRNAIHAVRARRDRGPEHDVVIRLDYWDEWLEIEVEDKGVGIDPDVLPHVFDAFFTSDKKGTGLGLAVVDRLVRQHRGTVSIGSKLGTGTTITVRFPP